MGNRETVLVEWPEERIVRLVMNRPHVLNAFDAALNDELQKAMLEAIDDPKASAIILTGAGGHFSAGGDINYMPTQTRQEYEVRFARSVDLVERVACAGKPIIAAVDGVAAGGALGYALHCDYIVATARAKFTAPFLRIGLVPDIGTIPGLINRIGVQATRRMIFERSVIAGTRAHDMGLCDRLVGSDELQDKAVLLAGELAALAPNALAQTKVLIRKAWGDLSEYLKLEVEMQGTCFGHPEAEEGMRSFLEKRQPRFERPY